MELSELRRLFVNFYKENGYSEQPASSLIPSNDPSVLFTTAGMQQFKDFYIHPNEAPSKKVTTVQPVVRTSDIEEVGDNTHFTMFEMFGNFVFGESSSMKVKESAIKEAWEFVKDKLGVAPDRVYASVFEGDSQTPEDVQSEGIWKSLGVKTKKFSRKDNFWGPTGDEGPCGPNTEIYIDGIEVWNLVFNQYFQDRTKKFDELKFQGLDTGSGIERLATTLQGKESVWQIAPFTNWISQVGNDSREARIVVDHLRAALFLVSAGIKPANKGREYILRRLIRRTVFLSRELSKFDSKELVEAIRAYYEEFYELISVEQFMVIFDQEKQQFEKNLGKSVSYLEKWLENHPEPDEKQSTELAFYLFESYGFPRDLVFEHLISRGVKLDPSHFEELFVAHQNISREGLEKQFKGGLADHDEKTVKHHTAHHLLLAALRQVLGDTVVQKGSNVTSERLRLDFNFDRKLTDEELKSVEKLVNEKIKEDLPVVQKEMSKDEAIASGAQAEFGQKYGEVVSVYEIGDFSKELCGGPHITHTAELGEFKILKEEASSQGVRRIKARVA